jgi:hypothetical protein
VSGAGLLGGLASVDIATGPHTEESSQRNWDAESGTEPLRRRYNTPEALMGKPTRRAPLMASVQETRPD